MNAFEEEARQIALEEQEMGAFLLEPGPLLEARGFEGGPPLKEPLRNLKSRFEIQREFDDARSIHSGSARSPARRSGEISGSASSACPRGRASAGETRRPVTTSGAWYGW